MAAQQRYRGEPLWIMVRYPDKCNACDAPLKKSDRAVYFPNGKHLYGERCCARAGDDSRRFEAEAAHEAYAA